MTSGGLILLVDDNEANAMLARPVLESDRFYVEVATSWAEIASFLERIGPDLILMDIQLHAEDGLDLTARLKRDAKTSAIPIIAVTAHATEGTRARAIHAGCDGYVTKPLDTKSFGTQMRAMLETARTRSQLTID